MITFYLTFKKEININKKCIDFNIKYISLSVICAIIFWLFTSPQMRYGGYSIISAFLMIIIIFFLRDKNFEQKKFKFISNIFLLIAISYFAYKNIYTSTNDYLNNHFVNFPWPNIESKVENVDYYSKNYNGITVNFITKNDDDHLGSPKTCGNVKMPCLASGRKTCISDLYSKFNYLFIINKNKECLEHFKRNYWQY